MLQDLKEAIDNVLLRVYDSITVNELFSFIVNQTASSWKAQAESGAHDDLIMALAIAWQLYQQEPSPAVINSGLINIIDHNKKVSKKWGL